MKIPVQDVQYIVFHIVLWFQSDLIFYHNLRAFCKVHMRFGTFLAIEKMRKWRYNSSGDITVRVWLLWKKCDTRIAFEYTKCNTLDFAQGNFDKNVCHVGNNIVCRALYWIWNLVLQIHWILWQCILWTRHLNNNQIVQIQAELPMRFKIRPTR